MSMSNLPIFGCKVVKCMGGAGFSLRRSGITGEKGGCPTLTACMAVELLASNVCCTIDPAECCECLFQRIVRTVAGKYIAKMCPGAIATSIQVWTWMGTTPSASRIELQSSLMGSNRWVACFNLPACRREYAEHLR